ncbi:hypothetical protein M0R45_035019 [Rubus argutus]|uniref:Uncharacterized protein n=1 Tax=Rubus argutus TaxID=59490 RepID=A0AAW1VVL4_RUBAR
MLLEQSSSQQAVWTCKVAEPRAGPGRGDVKVAVGYLPGSQRGCGNAAGPGSGQESRWEAVSLKSYLSSRRPVALGWSWSRKSWAVERNDGRAR